MTSKVVLEEGAGMSETCCCRGASMSETRCCRCCCAKATICFCCSSRTFVNAAGPSVVLGGRRRRRRRGLLRLRRLDPI